MTARRNGVKTATRWVAMGLMVALAAPSLLGALYHCGETGRVLAAPCAMDGRAKSNAPGGCCGEDDAGAIVAGASHEATAANRADIASAANAACCERIDAEPLVLVAVKPESASHDPAFSFTPQDGASETNLSVSLALVLHGPVPPPDAGPPLFLLQVHFLC